MPPPVLPSLLLRASTGVPDSHQVMVGAPQLLLRHPRDLFATHPLHLVLTSPYSSRLFLVQDLVGIVLVGLFEAQHLVPVVLLASPPPVIQHHVLPIMPEGRLVAPGEGSVGELDTEPRADGFAGGVAHVVLDGDDIRVVCHRANKSA